MYIKDEHPLRSRIRYYEARSMDGMGIGPEIVYPHGCEIGLQMSSPPFNGLMTAMTDTYTTLVPTLAPLPYRPDLEDYPPNDRRFAVDAMEGVTVFPESERDEPVLPVEMGAEIASLDGNAEVAAMVGAEASFGEGVYPEPHEVYTANQLIQRMSVGLAGFGHGGAAGQGQSEEFYGARPSFGTCIGCR